MDQQFGLVLTQNPHQQSEILKMLEHKKLQFQHSSDVKILLEEKTAAILFQLQAANLEQVLAIVHEVRLHGVYQNHGQKLLFPDGLKMIFTLDEGLLKAQPEELQDQILFTFSPIFRFES